MPGCFPLAGFVAKHTGCRDAGGLVDQIDHVCQLAGNANHAAIGTDLDGGYGTEQTPGDLDTYFDMQRVPQMLRDRRYAEADVEAICHGNWVRKLTGVWS